MDTDSIYERYNKDNKSRIVKETFYTEKIKDAKKSETIVNKLKRLFIKLLP